MDRVEKIEAARQSQGLSYQQLSDMSMLGKTTVYKVLTGRQEPYPATLAAMETALGILQDIEGADHIQGVDADYVRLTESRIARMRAHYNGLLAVKDRHLRRCYIVNTITISLLAFVIVVGAILFIYDLLVPGVGWIGG